ncbi:MAG: NHL repeat-containing protein [Anaerolineales bacterium]
MKNKKILLTAFIVWILVSLACATLTGGGGENGGQAANAPVEEVSEPAQSAEPVMVEVRQWGASATASSEYTSDDWSAMQAAGSPDTRECEDLETAWASYDSNTVETLTIYYDTAVYATRVTVYETYNPDQVVKVELIDVNGSPHQVFSQQPHEAGCPYLLKVELEATDFLVDAVRVTIDQSQFSAWCEIDAVELVGLVEDQAAQPQAPSAPGPQPSAQLGDLQIPGGRSWMVDEDSSGMEFGTFGDIAVSDDGRIFVPDNGNGILVFDLSGVYLETFDLDAFVNPTDVKIGPDGNLYVADWGADKVFILSTDGDLLSSFGESGNGTGQFGTFGPKSVAVGPNNIVFVVDDNRDEENNPFMRLMWFTKDGDHLGEYLFPSSGVYPVGMDFGPDGYLYIVNYFGGNLQKWDEGGNYLGDIAEEGLKGTSPQYIDFDDAGNMYLIVWDEGGVVFLDPAGNYLGRFGFDEDYNTSPWPDGAMNKPIGIAVLPDGSRLFFTDYANTQPMLEALTIR